MASQASVIIAAAVVFAADADGDGDDAADSHVDKVLLRKCLYSW